MANRYGSEGDSHFWGGSRIRDAVTPLVRELMAGYR